MIAKARSDNTNLFRNFADKIRAIPLQDEVHGHGMENSQQCEGFMGNVEQKGSNMENSVRIADFKEYSFLFRSYIENSFLFTCSMEN